MTSTVFVSGTVITAPWLNDVNTKTYNDPVPISLAAASGSSLVGYQPVGTGAVATTVQAKLRQTVSVFDFMTALQIADVQAGTYVYDVTAACQAALNSGAARVEFPTGSYKITGLTVTASNLQYVVGMGAVTLKLTAASNAKCFSVASGKQFVNLNNFYLLSTGTKADGLSTYGIVFTNNAYITADNIRADNFSGAGIEHRLTVYSSTTNFVANGCTYGLSYQKLSSVACTTGVVNRAYITGCTSGIYQDGASTMQYNYVVAEYCGSTTTTNAAFHLNGGVCQFVEPYTEAGYRNFVINDAELNIIGNTIFSATAADIVTFYGVAFNERGVVQVLPYQINTPRIGPDPITSRDCVIGTNLTAPLAGGSVVFGNETMLVASGTLTSATWTTVYTIPTVENSGTANQRALYEYTCWAGASDLSTGFDAGTVLNGTLRSYSGTTPAWLRLAGGALSTVVITGTAGQFSCTATVLTVGMAVVISGTFGGTGSITGYTNPTTYYIIATNGTTTFTLSTTAGGTAVATTAGTPTGLSYSLNGNVQMNVTSSSYGLTYKIVLRRVYPGIS